MLSTNASVAFTFRLTMVFIALTTCAAATIGSTPCSGCAAWQPLPVTVIS